jgi:hypothetical protein
MNLGKKISAWWNSLLCLLFGHTLTTVCTRCGKFVDLEGTKRLTLEARINRYFGKTKKEKEFKGSLNLVPGMNKYSINLKTNELRLMQYDVKSEVIHDKNGNQKYTRRFGAKKVKIISRKAQYDPFCVYIDAANDENAIRKANNYIRGVKRGVVIKHVTTNDINEKGVTVKLN